MIDQAERIELDKRSYRQVLDRLDNPPAHYGFTKLPQHPMRLILSMDTAIQSLGG